MFPGPNMAALKIHFRGRVRVIVRGLKFIVYEMNRCFLGFEREIAVRTRKGIGRSRGIAMQMLGATNAVGAKKLIVTKNWAFAKAMIVTTDNAGLLNCRLRLGCNFVNRCVACRQFNVDINCIYHFGN